MCVGTRFCASVTADAQKGIPTKNEIRPLLLNCIKPQWLIVLLLLLAACEPEPTPLPVEIAPAATAAPTPDARTIRYGIAANAADYLDLAPIRAMMQIETLTAPPDPAMLVEQYDILVALAEFAVGQRSPVSISVGLAINTAIPPLNDPAVADIVARSVAGGGESLRIELANAGYPDGFDLSAGALVPPTLDGLRSAGIGVQVSDLPPDQVAALFEAGRLHLAFVRWSDEAGRAAWAARGTVIDLYALPVVYLAAPNIEVTGFTPDGVPLARRQ